MGRARSQNDVVRMWLFICALLVPANGVAQPREALVTSLIFDECMGFVLHGNAPFTEFDLLPARISPARLEGSAQAAGMFAVAYVAKWGKDPELGLGFCIVERENQTKAALGVVRDGFLKRLDARAQAEGLVNSNPAPRLTAEFWNVWQSPGQARGLQITFAVTDTEGPIAELGAFSVSAAIDDRLSDAGTGKSSHLVAAESVGLPKSYVAVRPQPTAQAPADNDEAENQPHAAPHDRCAAELLCQHPRIGPQV